MSTLTKRQQAAIADLIKDMHLPAGIGTNEEACSIAAINLALTGHLTDTIPDCMSEVIGRWILRVQDAMPDKMRNSSGWKRLLPAAAGTGRDHETERLDLILDWMWGTALPVVQPAADEGGFGDEWRAMLTERTPEAARAAEDAARAAAEEAAWAAGRAAWAAGRAAEEAARAAARAAEDAWAAAEEAARGDAWAAREAAWAAEGAAAWAAARAAWAAWAAWADEGAVWAVLDPVGLLEALINLPDKSQP